MNIFVYKILPYTDGSSTLENLAVEVELGISLDLACDPRVHDVGGAAVSGASAMVSAGGDECNESLNLLGIYVLLCWRWCMPRLHLNFELTSCVDLVEAYVFLHLGEWCAHAMVWPSQYYMLFFWHMQCVSPQSTAPLLKWGPVSFFFNNSRCHHLAKIRRIRFHVLHNYFALVPANGLTQ